MSAQKNAKAGTGRQAKSMPHPPVQQTLFRLRVRYVKQGRLAYLGHLEVIHTIERAVRRAGLPYAVTQGFSPHMRVGFSSALPVGTASRCEWFDLFMTELVPASQALERLRAASAPDLMPQAAGYVDVRAPALTAEITRTGYRVELCTARSVEQVRAAMDEVAALPSLSYARGKKMKEMDLARTLAGWTVGECAAGEGTVELLLDTRCDNDGSLRPEILLAALDRALTGSVEPIVSTGIQDLDAISSYRVERVYQKVERGDGELQDPLPEVRNLCASREFRHPTC